MLSRPAEGFPELFGQNAFLKKYPYFLPCAVPATFSLIAALVSFLFLKESLLAPISIGQLFNITTERKKPVLQNTIGLTDASLATIPEPSARAIQSLDDSHPQVEKALPLRSLLIPRVLIAAGNYASIALVEMAFRAIQPLFLATPIHLGGLGLSLPAIGKLLSVYGILNCTVQVFFFARIHDRWGSKKTFIVGISTAIPTFMMFPVINALARTQGYSAAVWTAVGFQIVSAVLLSISYGWRLLHNL